MNRLQGKVAVITGAGRGIGAGIAQRYAREGARVGLVDLSAEICEEVVAAIVAEGGEAVALGADVGDEAQVDAALAKVNAALGPVDVLVNNAAVMPSGRLHETSPDAFDLCLRVNLRGAYLMSRAVIPQMLERRSGSIIHMASVTGILGLPGIAAYSATKAGLIGLARAMSTDYAPARHPGQHRFARHHRFAHAAQLPRRAVEPRILPPCLRRHASDWPGRHHRRGGQCLRLPGVR